MKIKFLGAASGIVTGSSYILTSGGGNSILIDLGMFQGIPEIDKLNYEPYDFDCKKLVGAVLTHAHLDHCGRLPILLPKGFEGNIWMTPATKELTELSLYDTAKIAKFSDKPVLFNKDDVEKIIEKFKTVEYHETFEIGDFKITMRDAGHILGSASLEIEDKAFLGSEIKKIVFSGDLGNSPEPLERPTETFENADAVVMESTYGDRLHPKGDPALSVQSEINTIEKTGGTLLIPAFSLERTQELLQIIMHLRKNNLIKLNTPIFLDSPMAEKATSIYTKYLDKQFEFTEFTGGASPEVIIAGGGMMTGGRIVNHAATYLPIASTRLLIVGYQGEGTLGRELQGGNKKVIINGLPVEVKAAVTSIETMSSHADQSQLISWLKNIQNVKKLFLTHGEDSSRATLAKKIKEDLGLNDITLPVLSQEVQL